MKLCFKQFFSVGLLLATCLFSTSPVFAEDEFDTSLRSVYTINPEGSAIAEHNFTVTNKTPSYYITKYGYQTSLSGITAVSVINEGKPLESQVVTTAEKTSISFTFPDEIVGEGKQRNFSIRYSSPVFANIAGSVLEITIPKTQKSSSYTNSSVVIRVPKQFGEPYRIHPKPSVTRENLQWNEFVYQSYQGEGVTAVFGETQTYQLDLKYILDNPGGVRATTEIALPPDTRFQRVVFSQLDPKPNSLKTDEDGNWLAEYFLEPLQQIVVTAKAQVEVSVNPFEQHPVFAPTTSHTKPQTHWESTDASIIELAKQYQSPKTMHEAVVALLQYTEEPLTKNRQRYGAAGTLANPADAVCQEYTDLFVAVARSNNIPARRATGYAYTTIPELRPVNLGQDVLHTWPEYFDSEINQWHPIDPTWEDTTGGVDYFNFFDLNHIVFAFNGVSSSYPAPAGAYKPEDSDVQTVSVSVSDAIPEIQPRFVTTISPAVFQSFKIPGIVQIEVENQSGKAWYESIITAKAENATDVQTTWLTIPKFSQTFLPFASEEALLLFTHSGFLPIADTIRVTIQIPGFPEQYANSQETIIIVPNILTKIEFYIGVGIAASLTALITGSVLVLRHKRQTVIRGQSQES